VQGIFALCRQVAVNGNEVLHAADLAGEDDRIAGQADLFGLGGRFKGGSHHRLAHQAGRILRLGTVGVLVHQAGQQALVEAAPVHADAHRLLVLAGDFDQAGELLIPAGTFADVAGIDAQLVERDRALRHFGQQLVAVEVEVADQRHVKVELSQPFLDLRHGGGGFAGVYGDAHDLGTGMMQFRHLLRRIEDIGRVGIGHRLNDHG